MSVFAEILLDKLRKARIVIYGIGNNGLYTYEYLNSYDIDVVGFADIRAGNKELNIFLGHDCKLIEEYELKNKTTVIVTPYQDNEELVIEIKKKGYKECISWYEMERLFELCKMKKHNENLIALLKNNLKYKNVFNEKRCFILGTGPSIRTQDLSALKNEYVFSVNTGYKLSQFKEINPTFHVFVDSMYFSSDWIKDEKIDFVDSIKEKLSGLVCFFPYTKANSFIKENKLNDFLDINYIEEDIQGSWNEEDINFADVTPLTGTVVLTAVLLAIYMGFKEIYLLGCDCTDILTTIASKQKELAEVSYAWDNDNNQTKGLEKTLGQRKLETIYHIQYLKFKNFRKVNSICEQKGILLYDCTPNGLLDCIKKKDFSTIEFKG